MNPYRLPEGYRRIETRRPCSLYKGLLSSDPDPIVQLPFFKYHHQDEITNCSVCIGFSMNPCRVSSMRMSDHGSMGLGEFDKRKMFGQWIKKLALPFGIPGWISRAKI